MHVRLSSYHYRWVIVISGFIVYLFLFFLVYPVLKDSSVVFAILPVAVSAWLGGARLGGVAGLAALPLNTILLNIVAAKPDPWNAMIRSGRGPESIGLVLIGFLIGLVQDQRAQMNQLLAQDRQLEISLRESEERYHVLSEFMQRQAQELTLLDQVRQALTRELELPLLFRTVVEGIAQTFGYTQVSLYLLEGEVLVLQQQVGYDQVIERISVTQGVAGRVIRSQQAVLLEDVNNDPAFLGAIDGITSEVCVPLFDQGEVVGILNVESTQGVRLQEADLQLMLAVGEQIGIALGRVRLYSEISESELRFRQLAEHIEQVFWLEDPARSQVFYISPAWEAVWGRSRPSLYDEPQVWFTSIHPDDRERVMAAQAQKFSGEYNIEYRIVRPDESVRWIWSRAFPIRNKDNQVYRIAGIAEDITERRVAEETLRQSEARFKLMAWATKDAIWDWDLQTDQIWWGEGLQKIFHYSAEMAKTNSAWWFDHIHPDDAAKVHRSIDRALEMDLEFWSKEYRFQRKDGTYADIMDRGYIVRDDLRQPQRIIGAMIDITERKQMEARLLEANEQMRQFLDELQRRNQEIVLLNEMGRLLQTFQTSDQVYSVIRDLSGQLFPGTSGALYLLNSSTTLVTAVAAWGKLAQTARQFVPNECLALRKGLTQPLNENPAGPFCSHLGEPLPAATICLPLQVRGGIQGVLHLESQDRESLAGAKQQLAYTVVEQIGMTLTSLQLREALREQSIRDPLTGLYNRRYMEEALKQQMSRVTRQLHPLGIIMIDIDYFKPFNDRYGHTVGDLLLRELGHFFRKHIRTEDIACRYGGEEFTLILPDASLEAAQQRAEELRRNVRELHVHDADRVYGSITLSLGVAIYPEHGLTMESVIRAADSALYRAKAEGRDRVSVAQSKH